MECVKLRLGDTPGLTSTMNRCSKSAGALLTSGMPMAMTHEEVRAMCKRIAPYIARMWRELCSELDVPGDTLDTLEQDYPGSLSSELAFQGLRRWHNMVGRSASRDTLKQALSKLGLRRAEDELRAMDGKRVVPYMGRPVTAATGSPDQPVQRHTKQRASIDRLSRPRTTASSDQKSLKPSSRQSITNVDNSTPPSLHVTPSKPGDICEVKLTIAVQHIQRREKEGATQNGVTARQQKDMDSQLKQSFIKSVMANQRIHMKHLKHALDIHGISIQRIMRSELELNLIILCHSLGAFETLNQTYSTGRLKTIIQSALVTQRSLERLRVCNIGLAVDLDEWKINTYRDMLLQREPPVEGKHVSHPVDDLADVDDDTDSETDDEDGISRRVSEGAQSFDAQLWSIDLHECIEQIDERYKEFSKYMKELMVALRIARPSNNGALSCLQDILDYFHFLRNSHRVGQGARTDLVQEYLLIVNQIQMKVADMTCSALLIAFDEKIDSSTCGVFHRLLGDIELMLDPDYQFSVDDTDIVQSSALAGMEQEMFGGFICYMPRLIQRLYTLADSLSNTSSSSSLDHDNKCSNVDFENEVDDTSELLDENKENVEQNHNSEQQCKQLDDTGKDPTDRKDKRHVCNKCNSRIGYGPTVPIKQS